MYCIYCIVTVNCKLEAQQEINSENREAKLKLTYTEVLTEEKWDAEHHFLAESLVPFIPFLRKVTMDIVCSNLFHEMMNEGILDNIPTFETLEYLDSYVCEPAQIFEDSIHYAPEKFWNKLPNIISLKILSDYEELDGEHQPIFDFINTMAKQFPKLEKFCY